MRREHSGGSGHEMRRGFGSEEEDDEGDEDEDDDESEGVLVDVVPHGQGYDVNVLNSRPQSGSASGVGGRDLRPRKVRR